MKGELFFDYPVVGGRDCITQGEITPDALGIVAVGNNKARIELSGWIVKKGLSMSSAIHPLAQIGRGVHIGVGSVVMAGVVINPGPWVGNDAVINTGATIDHDCVIERGVHVAPGFHICGNVAIGEGALIGAGSVIIPGVDIGKYAVIGAGTTVLASVKAGMTFIGSSDKRILR